MKEINLHCCQGNEHYSDQCLRSKCPVYLEAEAKVKGSWPYAETSYGNGTLPGPGHEDYLKEVRKIVQNRQQRETYIRMEDPYNQNTF